ncbi:MAG TPA: trypsin-like peptidase domain-containing protein, partial [Lacipirellulaceae bacterium]|nr:trypsin-like peptidase domain-containing protein [Lacipirellulaceae bacterium]
MKLTGWIAASCLTIGLVVGAYLGSAETLWPTAPRALAQTAPLANLPSTATHPLDASYTAEEQRHIRVYESANRSVVNIDTTVVEVDYLWGPRQAEGSGSGAVLDRQGHILTNFHVIDGASGSGRIAVTLASNATYPAKLIGGDKEHDIAVLKVDAPPEELFPIP